MDNNRKMHKELKERASRTAPAKRSGNERDIPTTISDINSYDSASLDGFVALDSASPPLMPKVQEGVGSFESWNYVFKNLERSGYTKDLGDPQKKCFIMSIFLCYFVSLLLFPDTCT